LIIRIAFTILGLIPTTRCGLLLQMSHVAWSVCLCVCVLVSHTRKLCKKRLGRSTYCFGVWLTWSHVLDGGPDNPQEGVLLGSMCDKTAMRPLAKLLWILVYKLIYAALRFVMSKQVSAVADEPARRAASRQWMVL